MVVRENGVLIARRDKPGMIVGVNVVELTRDAVPAWNGEADVARHEIALAKPMQIRCIRNFDGRGSDELFDELLFFRIVHYGVEVAS